MDFWEWENLQQSIAKEYNFNDQKDKETRKDLLEQKALELHGLWGMIKINIVKNRNNGFI